MEPASWGGMLLSETRFNFHVEAMLFDCLTKNVLTMLSVLPLSLSWLCVSQKVTHSGVPPKLWWVIVLVIEDLIPI